MGSPQFLPLTQYRRYSEVEMTKRAADFHSDIARRRTIRDFSDRAVPRSVIEDCIQRSEYAALEFRRGL